ncbi:MAG: putative transcriptional regulator [Saliniramus fredricksonii]|uniref:Putative transcriptional regulator n=1 Tax=Saliniramus fredricksonii TaxID=1653334 RepID=A0A0P8BHV6_9HYPH|nr:MAG: putative transcriptional regulator [Saliniramus fredricksonii]SCC78630.1 Transcriptional regulator, contains XRE-family HTH domain [Saliniramus fredricksonii]
MKQTTGTDKDETDPVIDPALTPFGARVRALRRERNLQLKHMAASLGVSSAYLSALERGERGRPTWALIQATIHYFGVIWDEADDLQHLAEMSEPRPQIDARGTGPQGIYLANRLARDFAALDPEDHQAILAILERRKPGRVDPERLSG